MEVLLDGVLMTDREVLHDFLFSSLNLPVYYGRNLDALYDCLTEISEDTVIMLVQIEQLTQNLGSYGSSLLAVFQEASRVNNRLTVKFAD